jgi:hypothetical protein
MKAASSSETSGTIYESTQRLTKEDMNLQRLCRRTTFNVWRFVAEAQCAYVRYEIRFYVLKVCRLILGFRNNLRIGKKKGNRLYFFLWTKSRDNFLPAHRTPNWGETNQIQVGGAYYNDTSKENQTEQGPRWRSASWDLARYSLGWRK